MNPDRVSIVIPAFNEAAAIASVVHGLRKSFPSAELIVVNDGSTDRTGELASEAGATVVTHTTRQGYGAALASGIRAACREYVLFCDGDGQHPAEQVQKVMDACDAHDLVIGARDGESHLPLLRRPGKAVLRRFAAFLAGQPIPDLNSGLRIVRRDLITRYLGLMPPGFSFSTTSTLTFIHFSRNIRWIPVTTAPRIGVSTVRQLRHGPSTLLLILRLTVLFEPLKVFLLAAGALFLLSLVSLGVDLSISGGHGIGDVTVLLFISTLMVFLFGLICDQVSALRREFYK